MSEREVIESIDGVDYRVEWHDGQMFIEPGHDKVTAAYEMLGRMYYFTERSIYRMQPKAGSGNDVSEAKPADTTRRSNAP